MLIYDPLVYIPVLCVRWVASTTLSSPSCQDRHIWTEWRENNPWVWKKQRHTRAPMDKALLVFSFIRTFNQTQKVKEAPCWHSDEPYSCDLCWGRMWDSDGRDVTCTCISSTSEQHQCWLKQHRQKQLCNVHHRHLGSEDGEIQGHSRRVQCVLFCACGITSTVCVRVFGSFSHELY